MKKWPFVIALVLLLAGALLDAQAWLHMLDPDRDICAEKFSVLSQVHRGAGGIIPTDLVDDFPDAREAANFLAAECPDYRFDEYPGGFTVTPPSLQYSLVAGLAAGIVLFLGYRPRGGNSGRLSALPA